MYSKPAMGLEASENGNVDVLEASENGDEFEARDE